MDQRRAPSGPIATTLLVAAAMAVSLLLAAHSMAGG